MLVSMLFGSIRRSLQTRDLVVCDRPRSPCQFQPMLSMLQSRTSGRGGGDTRMWDMYVEYGDTSTADEAPNRIKARLSALSAFAESQGLTGQAAFDGLQSLCTALQAEVSSEFSHKSVKAPNQGDPGVQIHDVRLGWITACVQLLNTRRFTLFYRFVFFMCRERGQKSISVSTAIDAWRLSLTGRFRLLDQWCAFVHVHQRHAISEDTWRQVLEFSRSVHEDLSNYDPEGAWPVLVDEFVDSMYRKFACSRCSMDTLHVCNCGADALANVSPDDISGASILPSRVSTLPGMAASAGSKRRRKDPRDEAAQAESVNCIVQRLAEMPSPLSSNSKRIRTSGNALEVADPMEGVDVDVQEAEGIWEQRERSDHTDEYMQSPICPQEALPHVISGGYDALLTSTWQPWPSFGRFDNHRRGHVHGSGILCPAEVPAACGGYPTFLSSQQDVLLHQ